MHWRKTCGFLTDDRSKVYSARSTVISSTHMLHHAGCVRVLKRITIRAADGRSSAAAVQHEATHDHHDSTEAMAVAWGDARSPRYREQRWLQHRCSSDPFALALS